MNTVADASEPAGFALVREAFETARGLPAWRPGLVKVGLLRSDGRLVATGVFHDLRQARLFSIQMDGLGYTETDGDAAQACGCDTVFAARLWTFEAAAQRATVAA
jgi:hypothetical protein